MFDVRWANWKIWRQERRSTARFASRLDRTAVRQSMFLAWEEHCVECAVPNCYRSCSLYLRRRDGACSRFVYGIVPNRSFAGHFDFGADVKFRRWGKLEAELAIAPFAICGVPHSLQEYYHRAHWRIRRLLAPLLARLFGDDLAFDDFVMECFSFHTVPFKMMLEYYTKDSQRQTQFRHSFDIEPGYNFFRIPFGAFGINQWRGYLCLYPEIDDARLVFTWLDFVRYRSRPAATTPEKPRLLPSAKIKCVAWDLDNTLWDGTLAETAHSETLCLRSDVDRLIRQLDDRGIIQTVVSKNHHAAAWEVLQRLGVHEYFIYPAINWGQKSENLKAIAKQINIGLDAFALIDDSPFERGEVETALPQVRTYSPTQIGNLLQLPEFDVLVTQASKQRRMSYLAEMNRTVTQASFAGNYDEFLRSCRMEMRIFSPKEEASILRCWELIQRSNQLNLSSRRYTLEEFHTLLKRPTVLGLALECRDRFGDYGIVGFASLDLSGPQPHFLDFVLSCRVAQKRVEHTFFERLAAHLAACGKQELTLNLVPTSLNRPLRQVFTDLPFQVVEETPTRLALRLDLGKKIVSKNIIAVSNGHVLEELILAAASNAG